MRTHATKLQPWLAACVFLATGGCGNADTSPPAAAENTQNLGTLWDWQTTADNWEKQKAKCEAKSRATCSIPFNGCTYYKDLYKNITNFTNGKKGACKVDCKDIETELCSKIEDAKGSGLIDENEPGDAFVYCDCTTPTGKKCRCKKKPVNTSE